jgi:nitroreductase
MLLDLFLKRRSIRKYKNIPLEKEKIDYIIKSVLSSPSSRGINPWEFFIITDKEKLNKLSLSKHGAEFLKNSDLGVIVCGNPQKSDVWIEDCSIASSYILLAAEEVGLGACWIQIRNRMFDTNIKAEDYIKTIVSIPEELSILSIISIGYPDENLCPHKENDLLFQKVHFID